MLTNALHCPQLEDATRHEAWCGELLFSRVLQSALPWATYTGLSRRLSVSFTPTMIAAPVAESQPARALVAGWREFFELQRQATIGGEEEKAGALDAFDSVLATDALSSVMSVAYALHR